jgi:hypothetical protein
MVERPRAAVPRPALAMPPVALAIRGEALTVASGDEQVFTSFTDEDYTHETDQEIEVAPVELTFSSACTLDNTYILDDSEITITYDFEHEIPTGRVFGEVVRAMTDNAADNEGDTENADGTGRPAPP